MIKTTRICTCDKCGKEITDVYYTLTCYAEDITPAPGNISSEVVMQNFRQNQARNYEERHLCRACKDTVTDGLFIL